MHIHAYIWRVRNSELYSGIQGQHEHLWTLVDPDIYMHHVDTFPHYSLCFSFLISFQKDIIIPYLIDNRMTDFPHHHSIMYDFTPPYSPQDLWWILGKQRNQGNLEHLDNGFESKVRVKGSIHAGYTKDEANIGEHLKNSLIFKKKFYIEWRERGLIFQRLHTSEWTCPTSIDKTSLKLNGLVNFGLCSAPPKANTQWTHPTLHYR